MPRTIPLKHRFYSEPLYRKIRAYLIAEGYSHLADEAEGHLEATLLDERMRYRGSLSFTVGYGSFDCVSSVGLELPELRWNESVFFINAVNARLDAGSLRLRYPSRELYYQLSCDCGTMTPSRDLIHEIVACAIDFWPRIGPRLRQVLSLRGSMEEALADMGGFRDLYRATVAKLDIKQTDS